MSKRNSNILIQIRFIDLMNHPLPNLYHEVRTSGNKYAASAGNSNSEGLGVWIEKPVGTQLDILVRNPLTRELVPAKNRVIVQKKGIFRVQAPFSVQRMKLQQLSKGGSTLRKTYKILPGDDLYSIAKKFETTWQILFELNKDQIKQPDRIFPGRWIKIPPKDSSLTGKTNERPDSLTSQTHYKVKKGETLSGISHRSGVSVEELKHLNKISKPEALQTGQTIKLRGNSSTKPQTLSKPTPVAKHKPMTSSSDKEEGFFDGAMDTMTDIAKGTIGIIGGAVGSIGDGLGGLGEKAKEGIEAINDTMSSSKSDKQTGGVPAAGTNAKTKADTPIKILVKQEYSSKDGTPKVVSGAVCKDNPACIFKGKITDEAEKKLVLEVNIRLAGFGGALPSSNFTDLTEKCIKQFQRDYMKAPETGKICGALIMAIDKFNYAYPIGPYFQQMKCPCGKCSGFGNGRMEVPSGRNIANEYPGIHRSVIWMLKAMMFYLEAIYSESNFKLRTIYSSYRCIVDNNVQKRTTVNHMGLAFDLHFNKNGSRTKSASDMEKIREIVFMRHMGATLKRTENRIWLEPSKWNNGSPAATTWVHYDVSMYDETKYKKINLFAKTVSEMIGGDLSIHTDSKILACGGKFVVNTKKKEDLEELIVQLGTVISSGEGTYEAWNAGAPPGNKVKYGSMKGTQGGITGKTINELLASSKKYTWQDKRRRFATGKYQTIPTTLAEARDRIGLTGNELYDAEMQERIFREYLVIKQPLLRKFIQKGEGSIDDAQLGASREWASIGLPKNKRDKHGKLPTLIKDTSDIYTGYHNDGTNNVSKSSTRKVREILTKIHDYHQYK